MPSKRIFFAVLMIAGPFSWIACSKKEEPPPTPTAEEPEEKPKKKKKKVDDEEPLPDVGDPNAESGDSGAKLPSGTWKPADGGTKSATSDADKQKLIACCTALKNAATAAGVASAAASAAPVPGMPPPPALPPKEELDKAAKECDKAVANWNGDLNSSLKGVKGATAVKLPSACLISG
jgi:hypothetical protein